MSGAPYSSMSPSAGGGGEGVTGPMSTTVHVEPNKLWRSNFIFNLSSGDSNSFTPEKKLGTLSKELASRVLIFCLNKLLYIQNECGAGEMKSFGWRIF